MTYPNQPPVKLVLTLLCILFWGNVDPVTADISAGVAKVDITKVAAGPVESPLFAKALVIQTDNETVAIISLDVVAIGTIGSIKNDFVSNIRARAARDLHLDPDHILFNASHCHGVPCEDIEQRTFDVLKLALHNVQPVTIGAGIGHEDRIMENRRMKLKSGKEIDVRHAYSLPPDDEVAETGPIDPEIGILRFDKLNGETLAVIYNFACHPIQGVPSGANTADVTGFSSQVIEDNLGAGAIALFIQGCGGDINPISYKDVHHPRDAEPLGNILALSTLQAIRKIRPRADDRLVIFNEMLELPRADLAHRIDQLETQQQTLLRSLSGTFLNLKSFLQLSAKHNISETFPSYHASRYLHDKTLGHTELKNLDAQNRSRMKAYVHNIYTMEELSRIGTNLRLLKLHQQQNLDAASRTLTVEVIGLRIGDFVMVTFPGELTVRIGLKIKAAANHDLTFVAGYTNGYIYYAPTAEQLRNVGGAQEDSDCILAPQWEALFHKQVAHLLERL